MKTEVKVKIEWFDNDELPADQKYVASISEGEYKHTVVTGISIADCFHQISISMDCIDDYKKNNP